jgi:hypothetical protein
VRKRRYALRVGVVLLIMLDTLRRSFLQHDAFDRAMFVVELLVLALIAIEGLIHVVHWIKVSLAFETCATVPRLRPRVARRISSEIPKWRQCDGSNRLDETCGRLDRRNERETQALFVRR